MQDEAKFGSPEVWKAPKEDEVTQTPTPTPASRPRPVPEDKTWFQMNQTDGIVIIVVSSFLLISLILLATSYRTYRVVAPYVRGARAAGELPRPLRGVRTAARLGMPEVFSQANISRLHTLGDMPQIPPVFRPRYATRFRRIRRSLY